MTSLKISLNKQNKASILFAQYVIEACIDAVSDYLSIKINKFPSELLDPVKSFDEKWCICEKHQKYLCKNQILCQAVCNEMALDHVTVQRIHQKKKKNRKSPNFQEYFIQKNYNRAWKR